MIRECTEDEFDRSYEYPWKPITMVSAEWFFGPGLTPIGLRKIRQLWIAEFNDWPPRRNNPFVSGIAPEAFFLVFPLWWLRKIERIIIKNREWLLDTKSVNPYDIKAYEWKSENVWKDEELACETY